VPNVQPRHWELTDGIGGYTPEKYAAISERDPYIQYLARNSNIEWRRTQDGAKVGFLKVDGSDITTAKPSGEDSIDQPSHFIASGRNGACGESSLACLAILKTMGYNTTKVDVMTSQGGHAVCESFIDGKVYAVSYDGTLMPRDGYYESKGWTVLSADGKEYDSNWFAK
jgi:hypothetical protein